MTRVKRVKSGQRHEVGTCTLPGRLMVSWDERKTCWGLGQAGRKLPGATPQMKVRFLDWLTPKLPALSTPKRTCMTTAGIIRGDEWIMQKQIFEPELPAFNTHLSTPACNFQELQGKTNGSLGKQMIRPNLPAFCTSKRACGDIDKIASATPHQCIVQTQVCNKLCALSNSYFKPPHARMPELSCLFTLSPFFLWAMHKLQLCC